MFPVKEGPEHEGPTVLILMISWWHFSLCANTTKSLSKLSTTHTRMLICDVYDRNALRPLRLAKIYLVTHKYISDLCCVNSFSAEMPTTQENHPENCLPSVGTSSTQNIQVASWVPLALFVAVGLTHSCAQFILWTHRCQWKTHEFCFRVDSRC